MEEPTDEICEHCSSPMIIKWGRNGRFMACSNYPNCKNTRPLFVVEPEKINEPCPKCGADLVKREGKFGGFIACVNYPECKYTKPVTIGVKCHEDGCKGEVTVLKSKRGKIFYGCTEYPDCKFVSWNKPINKKCSECGNNYMEEKESKKDGKFYYCPSCKNKTPME
ncbi:MAG: topoisomerase DNA-binding C4 zinc finger domain-containing protein [Calditrichia bacterium]|nr:topoisomerase DNA-binding C4 zinc finger domain-containing protein [Calditrichia bacterium]